MYRKILHFDLDAFFCAVEEQRDPSLRGVPFAVGGRPDRRGVIASCSYAARRCGVHSAMPAARALRLCPPLRIVSSRHRHYSDVSRAVMKRLLSVTPQVEQISIDEAFLEVTDLPDPAAIIARRLQITIRNELSLPCSLGVATNKLVAKIATDVGKANAGGEGPPHAIQVVPPGTEAVFLAPLPVQALWGVGPKSAERLAAMGIFTVGDLAKRSESELGQRFGHFGHDMARWARGIDTRPLVTSRLMKSVSKETTFAYDVQELALLQGTLHQLAVGVARRLQRKEKAGHTVGLKIRWPDFHTMTRQITLPHVTNDSKEIYEIATRLFRQNWQPGTAIRLLGVSVSGLESISRQLTLFDIADITAKEARLQQAIQVLQLRFGPGIVFRGDHLSVKTDPVPTVIDAVEES